MLRTVALAALGVFVLTTTALYADDDATEKLDKGGEKKFIKDGEKTPDKGGEKKFVKDGEKTPDKSGEKKFSKDGEKTPDKGGEKKFSKDGEKTPLKTKSSALIVSKGTEYYSTSPAQGRPADGTLKPGTKVLVLEKAGNYVRVIAQVEVFVPVESLEQPGDTKEGFKKGSDDEGAAEKAAAAKKKAAIAEKNAAIENEIANKEQEIAKLKAAIAERAAAIEKRAAAEKEAAPKKESAPKKKETAEPKVDKETLKKAFEKLDEEREIKKKEAEPK